MNQLDPLVPVDSTGGALASQPKLLDRLRRVLEDERFAAETVARFVEWNSVISLSVTPRRRPYPIRHPT
jgi:hypothetical protein